MRTAAWGAAAATGGGGRACEPRCLLPHQLRPSLPPTAATYTTTSPEVLEALEANKCGFITASIDFLFSPRGAIHKPVYRLLQEVCETGGMAQQARWREGQSCGGCAARGG